MAVEHQGPTPAGGTRSIARFFDADGREVGPEHAAMAEIEELDDHVPRIPGISLLRITEIP